ncbi:histidine phosphatase family protein [Candidatus Parcubacteria bacterium]|nr:histidine phosphatase family protein [Candidatus Parcubacteria bacterium]
MAKLILLRHLKSQWNLENRFSGWVDVPLCKEGIKKAKEISKKVFKNKIDIAYSSPLLRNQNTLVRILDYVARKYPIFIHLDKGKMKKYGNFTEIHKNYLPVYISENLNERYYGKLQGLNKQEIIKKYGLKKVHLWRRGFEQTPPGGESLKDTYKRAVPFFRRYIEKDLKKGKNVLIVASHNSLRAIVKYIEKISDKDIAELEIPFAGIINYKFHKSLKLKNKNIL